MFSRYQKAPKSAPIKIKPCKLIIYRVFCGVGGIRTLVQTSNTQAFYMLILLLIFVIKQTANSQLYAYLLRFSFPNRSFSGLISAFSMPLNRTSQNRTFERHLVSLLYFGKNANLTKLQIKQQEQTLRCQLNFVARDLRDRATVLCMLTYPLVLLSKPVNPNF